MSATPQNPFKRDDPQRRDDWDAGFTAGIYEGEARGIPMRRDRDELLKAIDSAAGQTTDLLCREALCAVLDKFKYPRVPGPA